jgi:hypothetical protein
MAGEAIRDIFHLLETTRARQIRLTTSERTQKEMARLPRTSSTMSMHAACRSISIARTRAHRSKKLMASINSIRLIDG